MRNSKWIVTISIAAVMIMAGALAFAQHSPHAQKQGDCNNHCCATQVTTGCSSCGSSCTTAATNCSSAGCGSCNHGNCAQGACSTAGCGHFCFGDQSPWKDLNRNAQGKLMEPLTKIQAQEMAEYFVKWNGNTRLKVGKLIEEGDFYRVPVVTQDNSLVENLKINKETGCIGREF